jgi:hypothetical protein
MALSFSAITTRLLNSAIKVQLSALAYANGLPDTAWIPGEPTERWLDITPRLMAAVISDPLTQLVRGMFLDLATDPGDVAADGTPDLSADQTPRPGFLSALGLSWFGTTRREASYAALSVTVRNDSASPATFSPYDLSFTTTDSAKPDGGRPTYKNTADAGVYTGLGGTLTLAPGASATTPLPLLCEQIGVYGSASANSMVCVTQSFGVLTVTASTIAVGTAREPAPAYRARCRTAADAHSPGGPQQAYLRAMNTAKDGTPLQRYDGSGPVGIVDAYVSPSSATNTVTMYVRGPGGGASVLTADIDSANANIMGLPLGSITDPIGVLPDTVGFGPNTYGSSAAFPAGTPSLAAVTDTTIAVTYSAKIRTGATLGLAGGTIPAGTYTSSGSYSTGIAASLAVITTAIAASLSADMFAAGINGKDFNGTSGKVYLDDLIADVRGGFPGLYSPAVSVPSGDTTITVGHDALLGSVAWSITVTA